MEMIPKFCHHLSTFLGESPENVSAIHCKAGKGRTGTIISAWMVYNHMYDTAEEAMHHFAITRTHDSKGVTIPSQKRYVKYTEMWVKNGPWKPRLVYLRSITMNIAPKFGKLNAHAYLTVSVGPKKSKVYKSKPKKIKRSDTNIKFELPTDLILQDDVRIQFHHKPTVGKPVKMFHFWFHTSFLPENNILRLSKNELDKAIKDKACKNFKPEFEIVCQFDSAANSSIPTASSSASNAKLYGDNQATDPSDTDTDTDTDEDE